MPPVVKEELTVDLTTLDTTVYHGISHAVYDMGGVKAILMLTARVSPISPKYMDQVMHFDV